ncbi:MAG: TIGR01212 family radical SAM protein [Clostridiales bacterium]|nr:TIGR01212 family radical SAM protein [Clostridiales bacterium]
MNPFPYSSDNKRYHTLSYRNRTLGFTAFKAVLDAGFTCPNIDGSKGFGGCIYCDAGSGYFSSPPSISVEQQLKSEIDRIRRRKPDARVIAYFQAHTNTYAPVSRLKELYESVLSCEGVCGLAISTRPDALSSSILDYLEALSRETELTVELGLQSVHDHTLKLINRCHSYLDFLHGYQSLKGLGIRVGVHLINGLPEETPDMMIRSAFCIGRLQPDAVKLHLLHVIRGTPLNDLYESGRYEPMTLKNYVDVIVSQLEVLPPQTVIERVTGDADKRTLVAPAWSKDKIRVLGSIDKAMAERETWQGKYYNT